MKSRSLALVAVVLAALASFAIAGCSDLNRTPPPPTVDNTHAPEATASIEATLGVETPITVAQLRARLAKLGHKATPLGLNKSGLFLPARYYPFDIDGAFAQFYVFKSAGEAKGAAKTVDAGGFVIGATPQTLVNVNWTGWPAFFRSGDMIVIFVTEKGPKAHKVRDAKIFSVLNSIFGPPFIGGRTAPKSVVPTSSPAATSTPSSGTTGG